MNSVSSFKGSLFVLLITGVTLIVSPLTSYAQNDGPPGRTRVAQVATVIIKWNDVHQTIDGFGTAQGGDFVPYLYNWPEPHRSQILDLAFSQANGIGLTILRSEIRPELEPSKGTWNYTDTEQVWLMKQAVNRGVTKLFASVWSPPAWMKTNGDVVCCYGDCNKDCVCVDDCAVKPENYQDFADFLSHYAAEYASANGVNIYAVSMTNEPDNKAAWRSCAWTSAQIASFLGDYLSPTFAANHIAAKVIAPETSRWDLEESYMKGTYNNPTATARLDIAAAHLYGGNPSLVFQNAITHEKQIWQTEASLSHHVLDIDGAFSWARTIHDGLTSAQVSGWVWWVLAGGPDYALISLDNASTGAFSVSKTMWALGNFSKFIRPGFVRIDTGIHVGPNLSDILKYQNLLTSAYKDPATGQFVIVAINTGTVGLDVKFGFTTSVFAGGSVTPYITSNGENLAPQLPVSLANTITIPAQSIVSYVTSRPFVAPVLYLLLR